VRDPDISVTSVEPLFDHPWLPTDTNGWQYDVTRDGEQIVLIEPLDPQSGGRIRVVQNWYEEFRGREQD
jgi:hypothetical protein